MLTVYAYVRETVALKSVELSGTVHIHDTFTQGIITGNRACYLIDAQATLNVSDLSVLPAYSAYNAVDYLHMCASAIRKHSVSLTEYSTCHKII